jgi:predicted metal-dependent hydrolase
MHAINETGEFQSGLAHFNAREFFEAHEAWEELWLRESGPEKAFLQGLIQLAAAFHHYGRGNPRGAQSLLTAGIAKLDQFPRDHRGLQLAELRTESRQWALLFITETGRAMERVSGERKIPKIRQARERDLQSAVHTVKKKTRRMK